MFEMFTALGAFVMCALNIQFYADICKNIIELSLLLDQIWSYEINHPLRNWNSETITTSALINRYVQINSV